MTFPVPSVKLFTTETSAIEGKVDNNANAVINLHISPSKERLLKNKQQSKPKQKQKESPVKKVAKKVVQKAKPIRVMNNNRPKTFSAPPIEEQVQYTSKVESSPVQVQYVTKVENAPKYPEQVQYVPQVETPVQYQVEEDTTPQVYAATYEELEENADEDQAEEEEEVEEGVDTESKHECFYRTVLEAYVNNPTLIKHYILFKSSVLTEFIKVLTEADSVEITVSEDVECWAKIQKINKVDSIVVVKDNVRSDFQVNYNEWYTMFKDYKVSLKYVISG